MCILKERNQSRILDRVYWEGQLLRSKRIDNLYWWSRVLWWKRQWHPTPVLLPGKSHGWRSLVGCSPWGCEELDTTERLSFHFSLSCIGEGNGNPLQCSCLESPRDGGAWWAAVSGVTQSRTRLKRLSSSRVLWRTFIVLLKGLGGSVDAYLEKWKI